MKHAPASLTVSLIVAVARNGVIGKDNQLIWHLRTDLQRFKALTVGKCVLMGRKTYESIGKPLPNREIIVLTRDPDFHSQGVHNVHSLEEAKDVATRLIVDPTSKAYGSHEVMVAGGAQVYALAMPKADKIYFTQVDLSPEGDTFFAEIDPAVFQEVAKTHYLTGEHDECDFVTIDYVRR
jgi:dihydrofolate reductase